MEGKETQAVSPLGRVYLALSWDKTLALSWSCPQSTHQGSWTHGLQAEEVMEWAEGLASTPRAIRECVGTFSHSGWPWDAVTEMPAEPRKT